MTESTSKSVSGIAEALLYDETLTAGIAAVMGAEQAIDTIREDMFQRMSYYAVSVIDDFDGDVNTVMQVFKSFEKKYKKDKGLKVMPASYRSSKSVIINALKHEVELTDGHENYKGKTALERQIKVARARPASATGRHYQTEQQKMTHARHAIANVRIGCGRTSVSDEELRDLQAVAENLMDESATLYREIQAILDARP